MLRILLLIYLCIQVDARMLTDSKNYYGQKFNDIAGLKKTGQAVSRVGDATDDLNDAFKNNNGNVIDKYQDNTARSEALSRMSTKELDVIVNPQKYNETTKKVIADKYNTAYAEVRGINKANNNFYDDKKLTKEQDKTGDLNKSNMIAFTDSDAQNKDIYYEVGAINKEDNFAQSLGHENSRHDQIQKGNSNDTYDGYSTELDKQAYDAGKHNVKAMNREMQYKDVNRDSNKTVKYERNATDKQLISTGTYKAGQVKDAEPLLNDRYLAELAWRLDRGKTIEQSQKDFKAEVIQPTLDHPATKVGVILATELSGAADVSRIAYGKNPHNGTDLTTKERIQEAQILAATKGASKIAKTSKAIRQVFKAKNIDLADTVGNSFDTGNDLNEAYNDKFKD